jgi:transketolase
MKNYKKKLLSIRKKIVQINYETKAAHLGSCLSCVEILLASFEFLKPNFNNIILSKGHAALAYYAVFEKFSNKIQSNKYLRKGSDYWAHITKNQKKKIDFSFGSLGYGLGIAAGVALGKKKQQIICIQSDGELNEGSVWESFFFISHHKLRNISILIDKNNLQSFGRTSDVLNINYMKIFKEMNYNVFKVDGHNINQILLVLKKKTKLPKIIICKTIKGKGIKKYENMLSSHYLPAKKHDLNLIY